MSVQPVQDTNLHRHIVEVYMKGKSLLPMAEENDLEFRSFLPPTIEYRAALDHLMRAEAARLGIVPRADTQEYERLQLEKALGHVYRALFDVADWMSINLREQIYNLLIPYSGEAIKAGFPDYYEKILPELNDLTKKIAKYRNEKDVGGEPILAGTIEYSESVERLIESKKDIERAIPSIIDYQKRRRRVFRATWIATVVGSLLVGAILLWLGQQIYPNNGAPPVPTVQTDDSHASSGLNE